MKVFILTLGTRGDFELFFILARELDRRGHRVTLGTPPFHVQGVDLRSVQFAPIGASSRERVAAVLRDLAAVGDPIERTRLFFSRYLKHELAGARGQIAALASESDYFISNLKLLLAKSGKVMPSAFVTYDPPASIEDLRRYAGEDRGGRIIELVAMSRGLIDPDQQWPAEFQFTGFWEHLGAASSDPSPDVARFVESGEPPVALTMGSMVMFDALRLAREFEAALESSGQRGILVSGWSDAVEARSGRLHVEREIPYDWLFLRSSCVIHHGGCGTVAAVLRAGKPSIVLPQIQGQHLMAKLLARQSLSVATLDAQTVTAPELSSAITRALEDDEVRNSALRWRKNAASDRGVERAADLIEAHWRSLGSHAG